MTALNGTQATATFQEWALKYVQAGGEARYVGRLIVYFGPKLLDDIDQAAVDQAGRDLLPGRKASTVSRQVHAVISAITKFAHENGACERRHVIKRPKQPKGRVRCITPAEADRLIDACAPHLKALVTCLFFVGAKLSELLYADWRQVDLLRREFRFPKAKHGEARPVPIHPRALAALEALPHREGPIFRRPDGRPYARKQQGGGQIKTAFAGACRRAGITDFHPNDCRSSFACWVYAESRKLTVVMELGGWASERMVLRIKKSVEANDPKARSA